MPHYDVELDISMRVILSKEDRAVEYSQLEEQKALEDKACADTLAEFFTVNSKLREMTTERLVSVVEQAEQNNVKNAMLWAARTKYKMDIDQKNASLHYLLQRASAAADTVFAVEAVDPKKKGAASAKGKDAKGAAVGNKSVASKESATSAKSKKK